MAVVVRLIAFATLAACSPQLAAPVQSVSAQGLVPLAVVLPYTRRDWAHWVDADRDCQDTRTEVLIAESEIPVTFADARHCKVARGRWTCPYTGVVFENPRVLDVDHLVPLEAAHSAGGDQWPPATKRAYANDLEHPDHLVAVTASANRSKGSRTPDEWMPPDESKWCWYVHAWTAVKRRWGLRTTASEQRFLAESQQRGCADSLGGR